MENNISIVNTKRIRRCYNIKSSNRSKINFIWRALKYLKDGNAANYFQVVPNAGIEKLIMISNS